MSGPNRPVFIANKAVSACRFSVRGIHPVIAYLSFNGQVCITLNTDDEAVSDSHLWPRFYIDAMKKLGQEFDVEIPSSLNSRGSVQSKSD